MRTNTVFQEQNIRCYIPYSFNPDKWFEEPCIWARLRHRVLLLSLSKIALTDARQYGMNSMTVVAPLFHA